MCLCPFHFFLCVSQSNAPLRRDVRASVRSLRAVGCVLTPLSGTRSRPGPRTTASPRRKYLSARFGAEAPGEDTDCCAGLSLGRGSVLGHAHGSQACAGAGSLPGAERLAVPGGTAGRASARGLSGLQVRGAHRLGRQSAAGRPRAREQPVRMRPGRCWHFRAINAGRRSVRGAESLNLRALGSASHPTRRAG